MDVPQSVLVELAERWEPEASASPPGFRRATCVICGRPMESMWHLWIHEGGFKKELHACKECGLGLGLEPPKTLVVVAAFDRAFDTNVEALRRSAPAFVRMDTSMGGHPSAAFIKAYHQYPDYDAYLFLQDSLFPRTDFYLDHFMNPLEPVVGWARFNLPMFDGDVQMAWVEDQYPEDVRPSHGIFGPIFYATRRAMEQAEPWFPRTPKNRLEAQGTERAWAYAFAAAGIPVSFLGDWSNERLVRHDPIFAKTFAGRP